MANEAMHRGNTPVSYGVAELLELDGAPEHVPLAALGAHCGRRDLPSTAEASISLEHCEFQQIGISSVATLAEAGHGVYPRNLPHQHLSRAPFQSNDCASRAGRSDQAMHEHSSMLPV